MSFFNPARKSKNSMHLYRTQKNTRMNFRKFDFY